MSYENDSQVGQATAVVTGIGRCRGTVRKTYTIAGVPITDECLSPIPDQTYTGQLPMPQVTVTVDGRQLNPWDYPTDYSGGSEIGDTVHVSVTGLATDAVEELVTGERGWLIGLGWNDEGIGWYSAGDDGVPVYRLFNPYATFATHLYTMDSSEMSYLCTLGWRAEGIGWYGLRN